VRKSTLYPLAAFTLVELLVGMTLSLVILGAVLSSYIFLGRNFTRSLGISSANQPTLESQARRAITTFAQDVRMANGITAPVLPDTLANEVTLTLPTGSGTKPITYYYNNTASSATVTISSYTITVPPNSLVRVDGNTGATQNLYGNLLSCALNYYDSSGSPYTVFDSTATGFSSLSGIKQVSIAFTSQGGNSTNNTLTQVYTSASPRLLLRNKTFLP
jgi:Tfp pilus assembly protein PilW